MFDAASDALRKSLRLSWTGNDGHGLVLVGTYLWMGNRGSGNIVTVSTTVEALAGLILDVGAAPDIMGVAPNGRFVYVALRGPNNLTGGPPARGSTPGVAVMQVTDGGTSGRRTRFVPIGDQSAASPVDPHTLVVRIVGR